MSFVIQVFIERKKNKYDWVNLESSDGKEYRFSTWLNAWRMAKICYPEETRFNSNSQVRVVEIEDATN